MDGAPIASLLDYLLAPASGAATHEIAAATAWHGRLMVLAWAVLLPLGFVLARYYKVTPGQDWPRVLDNPFWWNGHRLTQYLGVGLMTVAVTLIWSGCPGRWPCLPEDTDAHSLLGYAVFALGWTQIVLGLARGTKGGPTDPNADPAEPATWRGDHYDMTPRRVAFEWAHKLLGYAALALSVLAIVTGLVRADAPRWMLLSVGLWWLVLAAWSVRLERAGRNVDTYQAIWGPDPGHPGAGRRPSGFRVRRR